MARVLLAAALAATLLVSALELPGPIASHCAFTLGERRYDLCPLFSSAVDGRGQKTVEYRYATKGIESEIVYQYNLSLGRPLQNNDSEDEQCEEGTWVCMTTITRRPESSPEATQHVPIVRSGSSSVSTDVYEQEYALVMVMSGEPYAGQRLRALIAFECSTEEGDLELAVSGSTTHAFTWRTHHACPTHLQSSTFTSSSADEPQRGRGDHEHHQHPPSDSTNPSKPDQNLLPPVNDHITLRTVFIVLLASFASLGLIYYGVTHPPAWAKPYLRAVGKKMRRLRKWRGRPGESRLLRWAEEELPTFGLDEEDAYSEEDEMVNARAQAEMGLDVEEGERMPLKPSMLFSAAAPGKKGYGTYGA